jgi:UDP-glucose 4-epimerase
LSNKDNKLPHMKALIIGFGFIGKNLLKEFEKRGIDVDIMSVESNPMKGYFEGDIRSREDLWTLGRYNIIYSLAGVTGAYEHKPLDDVSSNLIGHLNILEACNKNAHIVFPSTRLVYGKPLYLPVDEAHPINPESSYAITKLATEYYYKLYAKMLGIKVCILRISNPYGPFYNPQSKHGIINKFIDSAMTGQPIRLFGGGAQKRDFLYVEDLCSLMADLYDDFQEGVFNVGGNQAISLAHAASIVKSIMSCKIENVEWPDNYKINETGNYIGDCFKIKSALGWTPSTELIEGIKKTINAAL